MLLSQTEQLVHKHAPISLTNKLGGGLKKQEIKSRFLEILVGAYGRYFKTGPR